MKYVIILMSFLLYTLVIFQISSYYIFITLFIIHIILFIINKIKLKKIILSTLKTIPYLIFIFLSNLIFSDIINSFLVIIRLFLVINMTYLLSNIYAQNMFAETISIVISIFYKNKDEIYLIIMISLSFVPILKNEIIEIKNSLKSRNFEVNIKNFIIKPNIFLKTYIINIINRINDIEKSLISKGYN